MRMSAFSGFSFKHRTYQISSLLPQNRISIFILSQAFKTR